MKMLALLLVMGILMFLVNCIFTIITILNIKTSDMDFESIIIRVALVIGGFFVSGMAICCGYTHELKFLQLGGYVMAFVLSATSLIISLHNN